MKKYNDITKTELEIMSVMWDNGSVTINELTEILNKNKSTTKTHVYRLLKKKIVKIERKIIPFRYIYAINKEDFVKAKAQDFVDNFFDGNKEELICMIEKNIK